MPDIHEIATVCLSLTFQLRANDDEACRVLKTSRPPARHHRIRRQLIDIYIRRDRRKEALAELERLPEETPHREALRGAIRGACLAATRNWVPALAYLQTAHAAGCRDLICLRWLAAALLASGQRDAALPILKEWLAIEPRSIEAQKNLEMFTPPVIAAEAPPTVLPTTPAPSIPIRGVCVSTPRLRPPWASRFRLRAMPAARAAAPLSSPTNPPARKR